jgi:hypothetical protein
MSNSKPPFATVIRGPVMLIAVGALFAVSQSTQYRFVQTWPLLLVLLGLLKLLERFGAPGQPEGPYPRRG